MDQETPVLNREKLRLHNLSKGSLNDLSTATVHLAYDGMDEKQLRQLSFSVLSYEQDCKATWDAHTWCGLLAGSMAPCVYTDCSRISPSRFKVIYRKLVGDSADRFFSQALIIERAVISAISHVPKTVLSLGNRLPRG